jgi:hypothetical protein
MTYQLLNCKQTKQQPEPFPSANHQNKNIAFITMKSKCRQAGLSGKEVGIISAIKWYNIEIPNVKVRRLNIICADFPLAIRLQVKKYSLNKLINF